MKGVDELLAATGGRTGERSMSTHAGSVAYFTPEAHRLSVKPES